MAKRSKLNFILAILGIFTGALLSFGILKFENRLIKVALMQEFMPKISAGLKNAFPDTYFLADQKKKNIVDKGIILAIGKKEIRVPQEVLYKWISVELVKKNRPLAASLNSDYYSVFDTILNEKEIKDYLAENIGLKNLSEPGKKLLIGENVLKIKKSFDQFGGKSALKIPLLTSSASAEEIVILGIGQTGFAGSSKDRITNIEIGSSKIDGIIIQPGEEFSTLKAIGRVTAEEGYKPEANIRGGKTVMALGGGLCQVSSTLFRAALNSGLKITARANHSYPVAYYSPQGTDAAIAYPSLDFKFTNDMESPIFIQRRIENFQLIFDIYGTDSGRIVKIDGPHILEKKEDGSLRTILHQEVYQYGELLKKSSFSSFYRPKSQFSHE